MFVQFPKFVEVIAEKKKIRIPWIRTQPAAVIRIPLPRKIVHLRPRARAKRREWCSLNKIDMFLPYSLSLSRDRPAKLACWLELTTAFAFFRSHVPLCGIALFIQKDKIKRHRSVYFFLSLPFHFLSGCIRCCWHLRTCMCKGETERERAGVVFTPTKTMHHCGSCS